MSYDINKNMIQKKGTCFSFIKINNLARNCKENMKCIIRSKNNETLVCPTITEKLSKQGIWEANLLEKKIMC